jgi:hypothetical protein
LKKWIALAVLALVVFLVWNRERVFVRDPLASVTRNDAKTSGEQVYINFSNDVLLENDNPPAHILLIQRGQPVGIPSKLHCIHWLACLTEAPPATIQDVAPAAETMTNRLVSFSDPSWGDWKILLR